MIYTVQKDNQTFEIDDNVFFNDQPKAFRDAFAAVRQGDTADFDNAKIMLLISGRIVIINIDDNE